MGHGGDCRDLCDRDRLDLPDVVNRPGEASDKKTKPIAGSLRSRATQRLRMAPGRLRDVTACGNNGHRDPVIKMPHTREGVSSFLSTFDDWFQDRSTLRPP